MIAAAKSMLERAPPVSLEQSSEEFLEAVTAVNEGIADPVEKLRYLRTSLTDYQETERRIRRLPWSFARRLFAQLLSFAALQRCLRTDSSAPLSTVKTETLQAMVRTRTMATLTACGLSAVLVLLVIRAIPEAEYGAASVGLTRSVEAVTRTQVVAAAPASDAVAPVTEEKAPPAAEPLRPAAAAETPASIWLVDQGQGWELYSNGLRIETGLETTGEPRQFFVFSAEQTEPVATESKPVGIMFHTSESDLWPLEAEFNSNLRSSSRGLVKYVQRLKLYNYVIDRFGRVFRVVRDETRAHHAGHGIWSSNDRFYLNLNSASIGICFESRWNGGRAVPITDAQLSAGRTLTAFLRQRYSIAPDMVVAHGLTSVNPKSKLIGHHLDWARGFPFEAFGLPNQYERMPPSVATFGFRYDAKFLEAMGEPWPGLQRAEQALIKEAAEQGITLAALRARKQARYDEWARIQSRGNQAVQDIKDPHSAAKAANE